MSKHSTNQSAIQQLLHKHKLVDFGKIKAFLGQAPYHLTIREKGSLYCLSYDLIKSDFSIPAVQEARGLILRKQTNAIVAKGFTKFFNAKETHSSLKKIDTKTVRYLDKLDGSLIKLYWDEELKQFIYGTNNSFDTKDCCVHNKSITFYELIQDTGAKFIDFDDLDKEYTYLFELIHPSNHVVINYNGEKKFTFLGAIHIPTLTEYDERNREHFRLPKEIETPKEFHFDSVEEAITSMNTCTDNIEGCIAIDAHFNRVKIKTLKYINLCHLQKAKPNKNDLLQIVCRGEVSEILAYYPELEAGLKACDKTFTTVLDKMWLDFCRLLKEIKEEIGYKGGQDLTHKEFLQIVKTYTHSELMSSVWSASQKSKSFDKSDFREHLVSWKSLKAVCDKQQK
jgi:hypothetical protein